MRLPKAALYARHQHEETPEGTELLLTTVGRVIFNSVLPVGQSSQTERLSIAFRNEVMDLASWQP